MPQPKKLDLALIGIVITIMLQGGAAIWWASRMDSRVSSLETRVAPIAATLETVARLDERTTAMAKSTERIERKLDGWEAVPR